jgi:ribosomal protein S20
METIMKTKEGITLIRDERTNRFYSSNPKAIIKALEEDLHSNNLLDMLCAESIKDMIKSADGKIHKLTRQITVHIILS